LLLADPTTIENPFFLLFPELLRLPMIALATVATVIASQAVITGAYSITRQAIQLGLLPRLDVRHTSETVEGHVPRINALLLIGVLSLTLLFRSSSGLAAAYVLAVAFTELVSGVLGFVVIWKCWHWPLRSALFLMAPFVAIDSLFVVAGSFNLLEGAWLPIAIAAALGLVMLT
jgi:KUP system potassium uptake protein